MKKKAIVLTALVVVAALGLWLFVGNDRATRREKQSEARWAAAFGNRDDLERKYPARRTNDTAKKLEVAAKEVGYDLAPVPNGPGRSAHDSRPHAQQKRDQAVMEFVSAQLGSPGAAVDAPPEAVSRFLDESRLQLDAVEAVLTGGAPPRWSFEPFAFGEQRRLFNGLGQIRLQRALVARCLVAVAASRHDAAARSLEASWNLNESLRGLPDVIPALLAMAVSRLQVGTLRKMEADEKAWGERLRSFDYRNTLVDALVLRHRWELPAEAARREGSPFRRAVALATLPRERGEMADFSDAMCPNLTFLRDRPLSDVIGTPPAAGEAASSRVLMAISMPNIENAFLRADRLVVDAELTAKIFEARRLRRLGGGRWPAVVPGIEASRLPGASWRYAVSPDGRASLAFSRELASPYAEASAALPLSFTSG